METKNSSFNQVLLAVLVALYLFSLGGFTYMNVSVDPGSPWWTHVVNGIILSIPLVLLYGSIYVLVAAWRERRQTGEISARLARVIHWAPRTAAILIIFFVTLFSLDVFGQGTLLEQVGGFIIHSLPSIVLIILLVFAWRRPVVGFIAFLVAGIFFLRFVIGGDLMHFLLFAGPLLLISALFYADWRWQKAPSPAPPGASIE